MSGVGESTSREAVIRRVRAMLVLAQEDRGGTPAEREVAARKARALADRHGLDLIELSALAEDPDRELGELLVELPARHQGWAAMLLDEIAAALGLQARPTRDHRARLLSGPAGAVAHGSRAYAEALAAIQAGHEQLTAHTTPAARRARRFLTIRYPDFALEAEVLAQLRYTPTGRLIAQVAETLALRPATARDVAEAIKSRQVAAVDADPEALEGPYFAGAIDEVTQRLRELEAHRHPKPPSDPQTYDPARDPRADVDLEELLSALLADERPRRRRGRRERTRPRPLPAWDPAAHHAGQKAGAQAPIGLHNIT